MPQEIRIEPPSGKLERNQPLMVPIIVSLEKPLKVRGIHAVFYGAEETRADYTTTSTDSDGKTTTHTHTAVEHVQIAKQERLLAGHEKLGCLGNLKDALAAMVGLGRHQVLEAGEHAFEMEVFIPAGAPPSHQGQKTRVFYELSVQVDIPLGFDLKAVHAFSLDPAATTREPQPVRTQYPGEASRGLIDSLFSPDVELEMALAKDSARLGETIEGIFRVETQKPLKCRGISVRLIGVEHSQAQGHTEVVTHQEKPIELSRPGVIEGSFHEKFSLPIQTSAPLTAKGERFSIDWFVQIELDVPWAKDPKVRTPIHLLPS